MLTVVLSVVAILNSPVFKMLALVVGLPAPSAVVENTRRPGMSFEPGVPSTKHPILAALISTSVPSPPTNLSSPSWSLF